VQRSAPSRIATQLLAGVVGLVITGCAVEQQTLPSAPVEVSVSPPAVVFAVPGDAKTLVVSLPRDGAAAAITSGGARPKFKAPHAGGRRRAFSYRDTQGNQVTMVAMWSPGGPANGDPEWIFRSVNGRPADAMHFEQAESGGLRRASGRIEYLTFDPSKAPGVVLAHVVIDGAAAPPQSRSAVERRIGELTARTIPGIAPLSADIDDGSCEVRCKWEALNAAQSALLAGRAAGFASEAAAKCAVGDGEACAALPELLSIAKTAAQMAAEDARRLFWCVTGRTQERVSPVDPTRGVAGALSREPRKRGGLVGTSNVGNTCGGTGGGGGSPIECHDEYIYWEISYDGGATWEHLWGEWVTVCNQT